MAPYHDSPPLSPLDPAAPVTIVETIDVAELVALWRTEIGLDVSAEFGGTMSIQLSRCGRSGLRFFSPPVAGSGRFYEKLQAFPWYYRASVWEHRYACSKAAPRGRVLDLGCGAGAFVALANASGLRAEGLDFNAAAVATARAAGLRVTCGDWESMAGAEAGAFDMVTAFQVLEHLPDPLPLLRSAAMLARVGGRLVLAVPDATGWLSRTVNPLDMPPHHVARWSSEAFRFLTAVLPLELEQITVEPLDRANVRGYVHARLAPRTWRDRARRFSPARRTAIRLGAAMLAPRLFRLRLPGQSLVALFRRVDR